MIQYNTVQHTKTHYNTALQVEQARPGRPHAGFEARHIEKPGKFFNILFQTVLFLMFCFPKIIHIHLKRLSNKHKQKRRKWKSTMIL